MSKSDIVARVIHVAKAADGTHRVVMMTGDQEFEMAWPEAAPVLGEVYSLSDTNTPRLLAAPIPGAWNMTGDGMRWRKAGTDGKTRMDALWKRHIVRRAVQNYLDGEGFIQIDCPLLVRGTTPDAAIGSFVVGDRYLTTSTELQMRRMQVGGFDRLYTLTQNFRKGDGEGSTHNPEFTMLEWVRVGQPMHVIEEDTAQLTWQAHKALGGTGVLHWQQHKVDLTPPWPRMTIMEAISTFTGYGLTDFNLASIQNAVQAAKLDVHAEWANDRSFLFSLLMDHLQQFLGFDKPVFVHDWPSFQTSSAQEKEGSEITERSEAYILGLEICNGFLSLSDHEGQKASFLKQLDRRTLEGKEAVALDQAYMEATKQGLPQDSAMALGFDRLVMLLADRAEIRSVLALAWDEL